MFTTISVLSFERDYELTFSITLFTLFLPYSTEQALYDAAQSSMDELGGFQPTDTSGFIQIESIRLKKWGQAREKAGLTTEPKDVYMQS